MTKGKAVMSAMMLVPLLFGVNQVHAKQEVTSSSVSAMDTVEVPASLKVGDVLYLSGSGFYLNGDYGVISLDRNGKVVALKEGRASVGGTLGNGQHVVYYITVTN
ncbi:hypothetical protein EGH10_13900 [Brevibacillus laterosporus]|uniref:Uncharacterized protein n=1 Tax=Brevibacillus laterosporus LMG 15441 TaxID=1042163 RepID=A0A075R7U2_BRELA|nr:hypothetical protein [Brevibacillus laterosporus]AIG27248.1 hypothetical protein BRLA_c029360 [Brevibacillus laterosporus LMG 15441]RJL11554.1 hypothetical protein DM460_10460 [Brevibacillus laterosporus]TPH09372.1 hypothetical protein EGH10_13900 [Brevibacillus laterosporus]